MPMFVAPAEAKDQTALAAMPHPPPVKTTILPSAESSGLEGIIAGQLELCHNLVKDGNGEVVDIFGR